VKENVFKTLTKGCPQGGVLSPLVWNTNFDPILEELNTGPVKVVGFADDACFLITGPVSSDLVDIIQPYLDRIVDWGSKAGLKFNEKKQSQSCLHKNEPNGVNTSR
jgi:hypothetical protein